MSGEEDFDSNMMQSQLEQPLLSSPFLDPLEEGIEDDDRDEQAAGLPTNNDEVQNPSGTSPTTKTSSLFGRFTLLSCAIMYASLNVCFRYLYSLPKPPSVSSLMTVRGWVTFGSFLPLLMFNSNKQQRSATALLPSSSSSLSLPAIAEESDGVISSDGTNNSDDSNISTEESTAIQAMTTAYHSSDVATSTSPSSIHRVALELCLWNYSSQILCNFGLLYIPSARASFLGQVTVVIVPILEYFCFGGQQLSKIVLLGCLTSFFGLGCLSYEDVFASTTSGSGSNSDIGGTIDDIGSTSSNISGSSNNNSMGFGDSLVLAGTVCWSLYILRISSTAKFYDKVQLQAWKNLYLAIGYTAWYLVEVVLEQLPNGNNGGDGNAETGGATSTVVILSILSAVVTKSWYQNPYSWLVIVYTAIGPGTSADILQQYGQERVPATESNLILSMEPVFTTIMGRILLGEQTSVLDKVGGAFLILGAIIAST